MHSSTICICTFSRSDAGALSCREVPESAANSEEEEEDDAEDEAEDEKKEKEAMTTKKLVTKAVLMLLAGTIVCAVISDPMVDAVSNFSKVCSCSVRDCSISSLSHHGMPACALCRGASCALRGFEVRLAVNQSGKAPGPQPLHLRTTEL